jgi:hypothetical protein
MVGPHNPKQILLVVPDDARCRHHSHVSVLVPSDDRPCVVVGSDDDLDHGRPREVEGRESNVNFIGGLDSSHNSWVLAGEEEVVEVVVGDGSWELMGFWGYIEGF